MTHPAQQPGGDRAVAVDGRARLEPAGLHGLLKAAEIDLVEFLAERRVGEAAFGQAGMERGLRAFEAIEREAGSRRLTLAATAAGLALAGANAAADPLEAVMRAAIVSDSVELHFLYPCRPPAATAQSLTCTRCFTLKIMPRTAGVASRTRERRSLFRPSPLSVASWSWRRPIGQAIWVTVSVFLAAWASCLLGICGYSLASTPSRRPRISLTFLPRRASTDAWPT